MNWQPIETAPKDTAILLYYHAYAIGHWNSAAQRWWTYTDGHRTVEERVLNSFKPPTHWMPLPEPPK